MSTVRPVQEGPQTPRWVTGLDSVEMGEANKAAGSGKAHSILLQIFNKADKYHRENEFLKLGRQTEASQKSPKDRMGASSSSSHALQGHTG